MLTRLNDNATCWRQLCIVVGVPKPRRRTPTRRAVSPAERETVKTLVRLHLTGWWELQAVFQDAEKHWKQLEEQQVATRQMVRSLLAERQPSVCVGVGTPLPPLLKTPAPAPRLPWRAGLPGSRPAVEGVPAHGMAW
ncbi:hypothetical protein SRHO_G00287720 [Serrasalmus rhombeus]